MFMTNQMEVFIIIKRLAFGLYVFLTQCSRTLRLIELELSMTRDYQSIYVIAHSYRLFDDCIQYWGRLLNNCGWICLVLLTQIKRVDPLQM